MSVLPFSSRRVLLWCGLLLTGCTDPFTPDVIKSPPSYLVVDGFLNAQGVTTIKLSRTFAIDAKTAPPVESRALAFIEDDAGGRLPLPESAVKGTYVSAAQALNPARKYRLHLTTTAGQEYASDYVPVKITPPVDAVTWRVDRDGLNIYVSAHDNANATQYYRWETTDTWEIFSPIQPRVEYIAAARVFKLLAVPYPKICWGTAPATNVILYKTTSLSQDVVSDFLVKRMSAISERLRSRYSINVQQYALTKEEYAYWELLRKNTESIGSLYDPQPAQLTGNVHCLSNVSTLALGFVSAHSVAEKRLFIANQELPNPRDVLSGYEACFPVDSVFVPPRGILPIPGPAEQANILFAIFSQPDYLPIDNFSASSGSGILASKRDCIDCRTRGSAVKPSFWP